MEIQEIKKFILSGCKFKYFSYDHKKALEEFKQNYKYSEKEGIFDWVNPNPQCYDMPQDLKDKYRVEKIGKLREIKFSNDGEMFKFYIGNRYPKVFYAEDFGVSVFSFLN